MEEIKVGEYVRIKQGYLGKYQKSVEGFDEFVDSEGTFFFDIKDMLKHSFNIIDLIEVGDIVEISDVLHNDIFHIWSEDMVKALKEDIENGIQLKSIVTKEMIKNIEYRLEGK